MSSGYIRIKGECWTNAPQSFVDNSALSDEKRPLRKQLIFIQGAAKINPAEKIDYLIFVAVAGRKLPLFHGNLYREALQRFKQLVTIAKKDKSNVEIQFYSNDFLVEQYKHG